MGIEYDAASTSQSFTNYREWAHTIGSGPFRIILAGGTTNAVGPTTATFDGVAMTLIATFNNPGGAQCRMWYLIDPPAGAANVRVNFGGNGSITCGAVSYEGVDPNNPIGTPATASADSTAPSVVVSAGVNDLVVDFMGFRVGSTNMSAGALQTARVNNNSGAGDNTGAGMSEELGKLSTTMSWTLTNSGEWAICGVALKPKVSDIERAVRYFHNVWDPSRAILDNAGRDIPVDQIKGDNYIRTLGNLLPTTKVYSDLIENPEVGYIESIKVDEAKNTARIKAGKESLLETFLSRIAGRGV